MAKAKAKTVVKKSAKAPLKKAAPAKKVVAKAAPVKKATKTVVKTVAKQSVAKPVVQVAKAATPQATPKKAVPPKNESVFARLLREKAERHEQFQKQNGGQHQTNDQRMPQNHASYSKFAGPRRRAS